MEVDKEKLVPLVKHLVEEEGWTLSKMSTYLQSTYPNVEGLSKTNLWRLCQDYGITLRKPMSQQELDHHMTKFVGNVGPTYGRSMAKGYLAAQNLQVGEHRVGESLKRVAPVYHLARLKGAQKQMNPQPYVAEYFGYNLQMDQNEKLGMYGVTIIMACDGCSSKVVGSAVMPVKNNKIAYDEVFRKAVEQYGLWEQLVVEKEKNSHCQKVCNSICEHQHSSTFRTQDKVGFVIAGHIWRFSQLRHDITVLRICSFFQHFYLLLQNTRIERLWEEVNNNVLYKYKSAMAGFRNQGSIDVADPEQLFSVSQVLMPMVKFSLEKYWIPSWNNHFISGRAVQSRGIPEKLASARQSLPVVNLLDLDAACHYYEQNIGGVLADPTAAGEDKLNGYPQLQNEQDRQYMQQVFASVGCLENICSSVNNLNYAPVEAAIQLHMNVTNQLYSQN